MLMKHSENGDGIGVRHHEVHGIRKSVQESAPQSTPEMRKL